MNFLEIINKYEWSEIEKKISLQTEIDVENAISMSMQGVSLSENEFLALISLAAENYLEQMATLSKQKTQRRFGKTIQLYIPLYLSNYCTNNCIYCGFNAKNQIKRLKLADNEVLKEIEIIKKMGYEHILLVTGESSKQAGIDYLLNVVNLIKSDFSSISAEIQPLETEEYKQLISAGLNAVYIYQETYNQNRYNNYHLKGNKADFAYRLATPERLGKAGIYKIGLGALLGLENWRVEAFLMALHLKFLQKKYWKTKYSISFPRIRPHIGEFEPNFPVSDKEFAQLIWAFRLFDEDIEMALTTRESIDFRNNMLALGITSMSAGSKTDPGGYATHINELEQFSINDNRSAAELVKEIQNQNYQPIWKDWEIIN
jgi:2-iminoacetate synthase